MTELLFHDKSLIYRRIKNIDLIISEEKEIMVKVVVNLINRKN